jgi:hypothetical protein
VSNDAKNKYHLYKKTLHKLSRYYKYITLNALKAFIDYIGFDYWEDCKAYFQDWEGYNDLFSYKEFKRLINYVREETVNEKHTFVIYDLKQNFKNDVMKDILNYDNAVESIKLNNSLISFIEKDSFIFVKKQMKQIAYDIDLYDVLNEDIYNGKHHLTFNFKSIKNINFK